MPTIEETSETLKRDIYTLLESNRRDWAELAHKPMRREERIIIRETIAQRDIELAKLLEHRWALMADQKL